MNHYKTKTELTLVITPRTSYLRCSYYYLKGWGISLKEFNDPESFYNADIASVYLNGKDRSKLERLLVARDIDFEERAQFMDPVILNLKDHVCSPITEIDHIDLGTNKAILAKDIVFSEYPGV